MTDTYTCEATYENVVITDAQPELAPDHLDRAGRAPEPIPQAAPPPPMPIGPSPDWSTREWGRPVLHFAYGENPNLVAVCDFKYHGMKVRGVRLFKSDKDKLNVVMPQKKYGEAIQNAVYFLSQEDRDTFQSDVTWIYNSAAAHSRRAS